MQSSVNYLFDLPAPVPGTRHELDGPAGRVVVHQAGSGSPVVLLHSINAAASAYEVRPVFEALAGSHRVFAPDLPGFGQSERSARRYDVALYLSAIDRVFESVREQCGDTPVDLLALSLSSELAARFALGHPHRVRSLALVSATGLDRRSNGLRGAPGSDREVRGVHRFVSWRPWSQALFDLLVTRASVRFFLRKAWGSRDIDEGLFEYSVRTARQPGARYAPLAFLSGRLFSADIRNVYEQLTLPVWLAHGVRGDFQDFSGADEVVPQRGWRRTVFQTGALPHFEQPEAFMSRYRQFLGEVAHAAS